MSDYSILINTCDSYMDAWPMFFFLLEKQWRGKIPTVYVNTETKNIDAGEIKVEWLFLKDGKSKNIAWGERLLDAVERVDSDYILMMLEDFYYESSINVALIEQCVQYMVNDKNIAAIQLIPAGECLAKVYKPKSPTFNNLVKREKRGRYKIIAGPTIWRKSDLLKLTKKSDSPWEWEYFGSLRTWYYGKDIYCWFNKKHMIFDYDINHGGAIHRGKWVGYKIKELCKKYNYSMNYGEREIVDDWIKEETCTKHTPIWRRTNSIVRNRFKYISNILYGFLIRERC